MVFGYVIEDITSFVLRVNAVFYFMAFNEGGLGGVQSTLTNVLQIIYVHRQITQTAPKKALCFTVHKY